MVYLMATPDEFTGPVNLGNPTEVTILDLAKKIIALTNSKSEIEFQLLPDDDPVQRCPNIDIAKSALGWTPRVALNDGLIKTVRYFETLLSRTSVTAV